MRKRFAKSLLCASLAVALVVGEAGTALAAEPADVVSTVDESADVQEPAKEEGVVVEDTTTEEVTTEETVTEETVTTEDNGGTEEISEEEVVTTEDTDASEEEDLNDMDEQDAQKNTNPSISYVNAYSNGSLLEFYVSGYAYKYEVTINGVKYATYTNSYYNSNSDNSPYFYQNFSFSRIMGGTYKIVITPYGYDGTKGTAWTQQNTYDAPIVASYYANVNGTLVYNDQGKTTGYSKPYVTLQVYLNSYSSSGRYEIQKKIGSGSWTTISNDRSTGSSLYYDDYDVVPGTKYYYRVRYTGTPDGTYITKNIYGKWSSTYKVEVGKPSATCDAYYSSNGINININSGSYVSGYEIYRSTSKGSGYKKIATVTDKYYIDKSVKSGTYYYKVRPYYYDTTTKKKYMGDYSDADGVKLVLESVNAWVNQTDTNQATISWDKVSGADYYEVYYKTDLSGDAYTILTSTKANSFKAGSLTTNTSYNFQVRAYKKNGSVKTYYQSSDVSIYIGFTNPRNVYVSKRTISKTDTKMSIKSTIKWDRVYGAKKIRIEGYNPSTGAYETIKTLSATATSYTLNNTVTKKDNQRIVKYSSVRIVAVNGSREYYSTVYDICKLNPVTGVKVNKKTAYSSVIKWDASPDATYYQVFRIAPNGNVTYVNTTYDSTSIIDDCLTPGVNYTYFVNASNSDFGVSSDSSGYVTYKHKLSKPTISKVTNSASKQAKITWKKMPYAQKYVIYRSTSKNGTYKKIKTIYGGTKTSYVDTGLTKGKTYYYKIKYVTNNDAGETMASEFSAVKYVKITK